MAMKNPTQSVYEITGIERRRYARQAMDNPEMKIIMVKGIGYIVVKETMEDPALFRRMGEVVARAYEDTSNESK
jgi:hypothetical protein